jgi:phosphopantetheinyl transferase
MPIHTIDTLILPDNAQLLVWEITESVAELQLLLVGDYQSELETKVSDKRKLEFLAVRVALKALLGQETAVIYDEAGKPMLEDNVFHISVSHSGRWIAVMAHPSDFVGLDIEIPTDKIQKLCKRFLSETEQIELSGCLNIKQLQLAWSAKEALYKIIGKEAVDFANQLRILPFEVKSEGEISAEHVPTGKSYQLHYIQQPAYTLVYCLDTKTNDLQ